MPEKQPPDSPGHSLDQRPSDGRLAHAPTRTDTGEPPRGGRRSHRGGPALIALLVFILIVLHQDNWFWESDYLVLGFMPIGLFYHAVLSMAAALVWLLATWIAWPAETVERAKMAGASREVAR